MRNRGGGRWQDGKTKRERVRVTECGGVATSDGCGNVKWARVGQGFGALSPVTSVSVKDDGSKLDACAARRWSVSENVCFFVSYSQASGS